MLFWLETISFSWFVLKILPDQRDKDIHRVRLMVVVMLHGVRLFGLTVFLSASACDTEPARIISRAISLR